MVVVVMKLTQEIKKTETIFNTSLFEVMIV